MSNNQTLYNGNFIRNQVRVPLKESNINVKSPSIKRQRADDQRGSTNATAYMSNKEIYDPKLARKQLFAASKLNSREMVDLEQSAVIQKGDSLQNEHQLQFHQQRQQHQLQNLELQQQQQLQQLQLQQQQQLQFQARRREKERHREVEKIKEAEREREHEREIESKATATATAENHELREWQRQWKRIMTTSIFYFDGVDTKIKERAKSHLSLFDAKAAEFFDGQTVTHLVTRRSINEIEKLPSVDILYRAKELGIKIWTIEKLWRFLSNLLDQPANVLARSNAVTDNLSNLLKEEKLHGPTDRDPKAKRDDHVYFKGPYLLIWDYAHYYRPVMVKEYTKVNEPSQGSWPQFRVTSAGRCPFVYDPNPDRRYVESTRKVKCEQVQQITEKTVKHKLQAVDAVVISETATDDSVADKETALSTQTTNISTTNNYHNNNDNSHSGVSSVSSTLGRCSAHHNHLHIMNPNGGTRFHEIVASGVNPSTLVSAIQSYAQSGDYHGGAANGLGAVTAQVPSKEVNNLKKKLLEKQRPHVINTVSMNTPTNNSANSANNHNPTTGGGQGTVESERRRRSATVVKKETMPVKELKPGYCENCKDRFDDFEEHIKSRRHRKFAMDNRHFSDLDRLLRKVVRVPRSQMSDSSDGSSDSPKSQSFKAEWAH
ncbi:hypothetical protein NADFUDRAFT_47608 [Nadsonia fulvescens var. elongata DSM 6958]|uniref:DBF4-type domain-containing protein n=1 Tax=Nadsonia fulvescens var. elongata DSM 6958 TaxID=857566 RepID=A0A1E3PG92_9ASCO|nr:hypothetical protein NADFUDRAFT_47608 [Nadsonia fulvescens var. elongata DSM 6958]